VIPLSTVIYLLDVNTLIAAQSGRQFTDLYLAELAKKHRMKLATHDTRISSGSARFLASHFPRNLALGFTQYPGEDKTRIESL
jgi:hypothetical protein